jgi:Reverse transcriptase (RNA-dependent DNA polymerase)/Endonuclease-reverse transcriptase
MKMMIKKILSINTQGYGLEKNDFLNNLFTNDPQLLYAFVSETWGMDPKDLLCAHTYDTNYSGPGHIPHGIAFGTRIDDTKIIHVSHYFLVWESGNTRYIGVYFPPSVDVRTIWTELRAFITNNTIVIGDMNARHVQWQDTTSNDNGKYLFNEIHKDNLSRLECPSCTHMAGSFIDHVFISPSIEATIEIIDFPNTDHYALVTSFIQHENTYTNNWSWNRTLLKDETKQTMLTQTLMTNERIISDVLWGKRYTDNLTQEDIDILDSAFIRWINNALEDCIPRVIKRRQQKRNSRYYEGMTRKYADAMNDSSPYADQLKDYITDGDLAKKLKDFSPNEVLKYCRALKGTRKRQGDVNEIAKTFSENYRNNNQYTLPYNGPVNFSHKLCSLDHAFSPSNLIACIKKMENGKATGQSRLPIEVFKAGAAAITPILQHLFSIYTWHSLVPTSWKKALITPISKKNGVDWRPISLVEVTRKIFEKAILPYLTINIKLDISQGGFRPGRGTRESAITLNEWIHLKRQKPRFIAFLDIHSAYDKVVRPRLWHNLRFEQGLPENVIGTLRALFDYNTSIVALNGATSEEISHENGLLQGSLLSPILYASYINAMGKELTEKFTDTIPSNLFYADDIALVADNHLTLQRKLEICEKHSKELGFTYNIGKCAIVASNSRRTFRLQGVNIPRTNIFTYLGHAFDHKGFREDEHLKHMKEKIDGTLNMLLRNGIMRKNMDLVGIGRVYKAFVLPHIDFGMLLFENKTKAMKTHMSMQKHALSKLLLLGGNSSLGMMEIMTLVEDLDFRRDKLFTRMALKAQSTDESFAIWHVARNTQFFKRKCSLFEKWKKRKQKEKDLTLEAFIKDKKEEFLLKKCHKFKTLSFLVNKDVNQEIKKMCKLELEDLETLVLYLFNKFYRSLTCTTCKITMTNTGHTLRCMGLRTALENANSELDYFCIVLRIREMLS